MKIITQLVILTLSLLPVKADQYCDNLVKECRRNFQTKCSAQNATIKNCCDLKIFPAPSGVYKISRVFDIANVYCDMTTDGGGWIVIQRNKKDSSVDFNRNWTDYEEGFGDLRTEFWHGLESMHCLTQRGQWEMRVDYQLTNKTWSYLHYNQFSVGSASEEYPLTVGGYSGSIPSGHALYYNGKFSTPDNDNDQYHSFNCAAYHKSGYWYRSCVRISLNQQPPYVNPPGNIIFAEMKIRPKDCII